MMPTATCQYCGWNGPADQCGPLKNAWERVEPGTPMPAGACPNCSASAMLDEARQEPSVTIVTTLVPEHATEFGVRSTAQALANVMWLAANKYSYPVEDLGSSGFRVAVYRETPERETDPRGYGWTPGRPGTSTHSAGSCTPPPKRSPSARIATSSAATR